MLKYFEFLLLLGVRQLVLKCLFTMERMFSDPLAMCEMCIAIYLALIIARYSQVRTS